MVSSPKMKEIISQIAKKHEFDLDAEGVHLCLRLNGCEQLDIWKAHPQIIDVTHRYVDEDESDVPEGDLEWTFDPDVEFFMNDNDEWCPTYIKRPLTNFRRYIRFKSNGNWTYEVRKEDHKNLAQFTEYWADVIRKQGWLQRAVKVSTD